MHVLRQFHKVKNGTLVLHLPKEFEADEVEVIILPKAHDNDAIDQEANSVQKAIHTFLSIDASKFTPEQREAFELTSQRLQNDRLSDESRFFGLYQGLAELPEDFDTLSDAELDLFYADNIFPGNEATPRE